MNPHINDYDGGRQNNQQSYQHRDKPILVLADHLVFYCNAIIFKHNLF